MITKEHNFSFEIVVNNRVVTEQEKFGDIYILATEGLPYLVRIRNYSNIKSLAIINAEGLCIADGVSLGEYGIGYIIEPGQRIDVSKWHIKQLDRSELIFNQVPQEQIVIMDEPTDPHAISAIFFHEQNPPIYSPDYPDQMAIATIESSRIGWGTQYENQKRRWVQFAREETPCSQARIIYNLKK